MSKIKDLFINFIATVIVIIGSILMNYFVRHEVSFVTILYGIVALLILWGSIDYWSSKLKKLFNID
jgi:uncharacterized membrane protein YcaP (DUF421 family)